MRKFSLTLLILFSTCLAHAGRIHDVKALLERTVYACPDRIWKGVDWRAAKITLVSPSTGEGIVLQHGQVEILNKKESRQLSSNFDIQENGVAVNVDYHQSAEDAFALLVHEGFHAFGQSDMEQTTEGRDAVYPAPYEPRLEREELTRSLIGHLRGEEGALEKAAAWHQRHASHKEPLGSDVIEGSAEYVEKVATAIAKLGCDASEKAIIDSALENIAEQGGAFDKEYEHYRIGALSFLLARPQMQKVLSQMDDSSLPLDILLKDVRADRSISPDMLLDHAAEMTVAMANRQAEDVMNPIKEAIKLKQTLVFVPREKLIGSFVHRGSFISEGKTYFQSLELSIDGSMIEGHGFQAESCGNQKGFMVVSEKPVEGASKSVDYLGASVICL